MVGKVDKSCGAETVENGLSGLETLRGSASEEVGEVYYL